MSIFSDIFSWVEDAINSVFSSINIVKSTVMDEVEKPVKNMVQQVTNGIWVGKGADAFVNEMNSKFMQATGQLTGHADNFQKIINNAAEVVKNADTKGNQVAGGLDDLFNF
jgi:uncharacterized protein YukE